MQKFTVWVCQSDGRGTTHVSSHCAASASDAGDMAIAETRADWEWSEDRALHVLGIATGDVQIVEWNDLFE